MDCQCSAGTGGRDVCDLILACFALHPQQGTLIGPKNFCHDACERAEETQMKEPALASRYLSLGMVTVCLRFGGDACVCVTPVTYCR